MRAVVWLQIFIISILLGYSTYSLFKGNFEQAFLPYPILIIYYLLLGRRKVENTTPTKGQDNNITY